MTTNQLFVSHGRRHEPRRALNVPVGVPDRALGRGNLLLIDLPTADAEHLLGLSLQVRLGRKTTLMNARESRQPRLLPGDRSAV